MAIGGLAGSRSLVGDGRCGVSLGASSSVEVESLVVEPIPLVGGVVRLPGSKSLSNRALLLAALCEGETTVENLLASDDTERMLEALAAIRATQGCFNCTSTLECLSDRKGVTKNPSTLRELEER